jgi:hypothetical protein
MRNRDPEGGDVRNDRLSCELRILEELAGDPRLLARLQQKARRCAMDNYPWDRKAEAVTNIMNWVLRRGTKPHLPCPPTSQSGRVNGD